jgi:hypothetical protein
VGGSNAGHAVGAEPFIRLGNGRFTKLPEYWRRTLTGVQEIKRPTKERCRMSGGLS